MKNYKDYEKTYIGTSDIAKLVCVGFDRDNLKSDFIRFVEDNDYYAYIVDNDTEIPERYELVAEYDTWCKIYDDTKMTVSFDCPIKIYRCGKYGVIIQKGEQTW